MPPKRSRTASSTRSTSPASCASGRSSSAAALEAKSPLALAYAKEAVNLSLQGPHRSNLEREARLFAMLFASEDQKEGMAAFVGEAASGVPRPLTGA